MVDKFIIDRFQKFRKGLEDELDRLHKLPWDPETKNIIGIKELDLIGLSMDVHATFTFIFEILDEIKRDYEPKVKSVPKVIEKKWWRIW